MNAGMNQRMDYKSYLKFVFELSLHNYGENYWKSPLMINNIWISDLFLKVSTNRVDKSINYLLDLKEYLRELVRYSFLKVESTLVKIAFGLNSSPGGYANMVFTFVDERCFANGIYSDVFTGKLVEELKDDVLRIPVFVKLNWVKKIRFYRYLKINNIPTYLAIHNIRYPRYNKSLFKKTVVLNDIDFTNNFYNDYIKFKSRGMSTNIGFEEFGEFDLSAVTNVYYPFENQIWERVLCNSLHNNQTFHGKVIGLQNAPLTLLSLRYILPYNWEEYFPHPDIIISRDEISFHRLKDNWGTRCVISKGSNQRKFIKMHNRELKQHKNIFVALSIGVAESTALLNFIDKNRLNEKTYNVAFHPLLPNRLKSLLIKLSEDSEYVKMVKYDIGLETNGYVMSTTSTALLEGLYNGLRPLKFIHHSFVSASPLDFDQEYDEFVSFENLLELENLIKNEKFDRNTLEVQKLLEGLLD